MTHGIISTMPMPKGAKNPHDDEWNKKISDGVKRQWAEGRGRAIGFKPEDRLKGNLKNWRGENASKAAKHRWVSLKKGKPNKCEICLTTKERKYEWANIDHKYRRVLNDYIRMCTSCHRKYDIENNNYSVNKWH